MRARKRFGQHFLADAAVVDHIVSSMVLKQEDRLVEIGPGRAALTGALAERVRNLTLIELDRDLVPFLRAGFPNANVVQGDVLAVPIAEHVAPPYRVVGNLPYNISSPLILKLLAHLDEIQDMHFMLQKEMAVRLCAPPGTKAWGRLSVQVQYHCSVELLFDVPPEAFEPPPKVNSAVVRLQPLPQRLPLDRADALDTVLKAVFSSRRKRLSNALKPLGEGWDFSALSVDEGVRAEQVTLQDFVTLANQLARQEP